MNGKYGIIEIGSNNTKTHIYEQNRVIYDKTTTIEFKKNYKNNGKISDADLEKLYKEISKALEYTENIHIYGCSIFRNINDVELEQINGILKNKFNLTIEIISQEDEANLTAKGCYQSIDYADPICIFIGGGGSIELIFVKNKEIFGRKFYNFGVVDVTNKYLELKDDIPKVTFAEVTEYVNSLIGNLDYKANVIILAGGDHLYWFNHALYKMDDNTLYANDRQKYMIKTEKIDAYDHDMMVSSLDAIRRRSDNSAWFDGARAMRIVANSITHKIGADIVIPTNINMEDGLKEILNN